MTSLDTSDALEGIAIIGLAGRFPQANNLAEFWQNLCDGIAATSFFTDEELEAAGVNPTLLTHPSYVKARAILSEPEYFDAAFFGFSPREAEIIDPQHRVFLECAWETLENAGYDPETYAGSIGVYAGSSMNTYLLDNLASNPDLLELIGEYQVMLGNDKDFLPTRVSYKLNLKGPSVNIQTACSTSLVAVSLACQSLLSYECDMALAGGVSVMFPQRKGYIYREGGILSPDGYCRTFDSKAQGMFAGQGVGIVALKRLEDAVADGDTIHAVIKGSAINNDGSLKVGYTAPSIEGQAEVIRMAQALADVSPESISYVEAHGTATPLGDPIEIAGLTQAFRVDTDENGFCAIGSVKTNIGHLDAAAGIAGLIKTVLALEHQKIPPSLHYERPNPKIDFESSPFYVNTALSEWKANGTPRRAGVSSFGIGGTNAHVVLEEAPPTQISESKRPWHLLTVSAQTETALETATDNLAQYLQQHPTLNLADAAYTLQVGRRDFDFRRTIVCTDSDDAVNALQSLDTNHVFTHFQEPRETSVVFMFPGQGSQYVNMGLELYQVEPVFREQIDFCAEFLKPHLGLDLRNVLYPGVCTGETPDEAQLAEATQQLRQTNMTQPALFVIEYALAQLWMSWGIEPRAMIGHSIGEYVAACLAGVFSLEDALTLVATRGQLMHEMPAGSMLVVPLAEEAVRPYLNATLSLAVINGPSYCVVSGPTEAVEALETKLAAQDISGRRLHTSHAFHSTMMETAVAPFTAQMQGITLSPPQIPFLSNVSGTWITPAEATDPDYWARHLRQTVRFADGISELLKEPDWVLLEVGPGHVLSSLVEQHPHKPETQIVVSSVRHPQNQRSDVAFLLTALGKLWLVGAKPDWPQLYGPEKRQRIPLPTYPFERQRYWIEPRRQTNIAATALKTSTKKADMADWFYVPTWKQQEPLPFSESVITKQKRRWLVFADECGLSSGLINQLQQMNQDVIRVRPGTQFEQIDETTYLINPQTRDDYGTLLQKLAASQKAPEIVLHAWGVTEDTAVSSDLALLDETQHLGFYSLLFLTQALGRQGNTDPLHLQVITNNMQAVTGKEILHPEKATIIGPCRITPLEYPYITCRSVDITLPQPESEQETQLLNHLLAEAVTKSTDTVIAYREESRWAQVFAANRLEETVEDAPKLREKGTYLITGGMGGIGLTLAAYLAETVQARLVLTGRSALPAREEWSQWLSSHDAQDSTSRKIQKVQALEAAGAEVLIVRADTADLAQMQAAVAQAREQFGDIHGVVHAAGIAGGGLIQLKTPEMAANVLSAKVKGTLVLEKVLADTQLDFLVLCSSINSALAAFGQIDYCGANAFLDAFAHRHHGQNGTAVISINWDTWQEVGMAVDTEIPEHLKEQRKETLKHGLLIREGQEVFGRILSHPLSQVLVSTQDFNNLLEQKKSGAAGTLGGLEKETPSSRRTPSSMPSLAHPRPNLQHNYVAPTNETERAIANIWQEFLGVAQVGIHDNFFDLGGSSLLALRVFPEIEKISGKKLPMAALLEAPTVAQLATLVGGETQPISWSSLIPIQPTGSRPPLFCVHAAGGHVLFYRDLSRRLGPDQPFYGLQAQGLDGKEPVLTRIEDMASHYLKEIKLKQPTGPYMLAGYCMGGTVALEIAQQLRAEGHEVALLALFETYNWEHMKDESFLDTTRFFGQKFVFHWNNFWLLNTKEKQIFLMEKIKVARGRTRVWYGMLMSKLGRQSDEENEQQLRPGQVWVTNDEAALAYRPKTYPGRITHFIPVKEYSRHQGPEMGWNKLAAQGVNTHKMPVYPAAMLVEPFVEQTAEILEACIDEALATTPTPQS